jgi:hypothetical protein
MGRSIDDDRLEGARAILRERPELTYKAHCDAMRSRGLQPISPPTLQKLRLDPELFADAEADAEAEADDAGAEAEAPDPGPPGSIKARLRVALYAGPELVAELEDPELWVDVFRRIYAGEA